MKKTFNLNEEIICDFKVTKERKKVWKVELDLLNEFIRVCDKYNLHYAMDGGSMLGAVRHNGIIPWDDDIDVLMLRADYNKLLEIASKEFNEPYFFQNPYNDQIYRSHSQLRNSNTTGILPDEINYKYNQGIFIDIFPLDEYPKGKIRCKIHEFRCTFLSKVLGSYIKNLNGNKNWKTKIISPFVKIIGYKKLYKHYEDVCSKYNGKGSKELSEISFLHKVGETGCLTEQETLDTIDMPFENMTVKVPRNYDKYLKTLYGDYNAFVKGQSSHGKIYFSTNIPYKEFIKDVKKNIINPKDYILS